MSQPAWANGRLGGCLRSKALSPRASYALVRQGAHAFDPHGSTGQRGYLMQMGRWAGIPCRSRRTTPIASPPPRAVAAGIQPPFATRSTEQADPRPRRSFREMRQACDAFY
jgi:hypothetical protein